MKTIQALFEIIRYDEISGLFDRLEQSYSALTESINLEIPEDAGVEEVMAFGCETTCGSLQSKAAKPSERFKVNGSWLD